MSDRPISLSARRMEADKNPSNHNPRAALETALEDYDRREAADRPDHIIVLFGKNEPDDSSLSCTKYVQAGKYSYHAQVGLLFEVQQMIRESGE